MVITFFRHCSMAMLDFDTVVYRYCNLVAGKQKNVYINACNGVGRIFDSVGGECTKDAVSIQVIPRTCNGGGGGREPVEALKSHKFASQSR